MAEEELKRNRQELAVLLHEVESKTRRMPQLGKRQTIVGIAQDGKLEFGHNDELEGEAGSGLSSRGQEQRQNAEAEAERLTLLMQQSMALAQQVVELEAR